MSSGSIVHVMLHRWFQQHLPLIVKQLYPQRSITDPNVAEDLRVSRFCASNLDTSRHAAHISVICGLGAPHVADVAAFASHLRIVG